MDGVTHAIDQRDEVRKLQNLVRQLELQNAQLRSRQRPNTANANTNSNANSHPAKASPHPPPTTNLRRRTSNTQQQQHKATLDDVDVIDLDELDLSDEDSWLFQSPKKLTDEQKSISPYKWMRRDVEDPDNTDLQTAKQALVNKLDEIARARFGGLNRLHLAVRKNPLATELVSPQLKASLGLNRNIDTRTFTRPKKKRESVLDSHHHHLFLNREMKIPEVVSAMTSAGGIPQQVQCMPRTLESMLPTPMLATDPDTPEDDNLSTASDSSFSLSSLHRLADVVDVQALARMQEESLRDCSPMSSPRRGSASSSQPSTTSPTLGLDGNISHSNPESLDELPPHSPSESPLQCLAEKSKGGTTGNFRRSLPNLNKSHQHGGLRTPSGLPPNLRQHFSESRLPNAPVHLNSSRSSQDENSDKESGEVTPVKVVQLRKDSLPLSLSSPAVRSSSPGPRTGIPQFRRSNSPGENAASSSPRSHLPKPVQSRIPPPRMRIKTQQPQATAGNNSCTTPSCPPPHSTTANCDESWKEGCF